MRTDRIVKTFTKKKVLIIGDLILDHYLFGKVQRISPEAPVPVVEVVKETYLLGGAANVANNIISLGGRVSITGIAGNDPAGSIMKNIFAERGINCEGIITDKRPTSIKSRVIAHNQQVVRFDTEERRKLEGKNYDTMLEYLKYALPLHDAVIVSDYAKGVISGQLMKSIVKYAKQNGTFVAVDPKVGHFHFYKNVSLITPNLTEASQGSGIEVKDEKSLLNAGRTLLNRLKCGAVLITRGEDGMSLFQRKTSDKDLDVVHIPTVAKKVFDVTGAGDTVVAAFTLAHAAGASLKSSAVIANHAAGIVVGQVGTAAATPEELIRSLEA
ncbi:MAG: D-glycero-beta-D-manno-heptose-7-phosphate kinase [Dissulfurispiraceae bacterium]|jgi:D-beta-D-heptose 7-phosphate kinase/D-beta-D-heptose 1-phosphate adenosyltransferase|nr:D-glycero-beta-D-manno-heptose-7-phosphate kinase [Dissulfurispiraceae bacterium]